jgi:hypothetical protein
MVLRPITISAAGQARDVINTATVGFANIGLNAREVFSGSGGKLQLRWMHGLGGAFSLEILTAALLVAGVSSRLIVTIDTATAPDVTVYHNNVSAGSGNLTTPSANDPAYAAKIGLLAAGSGWDGHIPAWGIIPRQITTAERLKLHTWMGYWT